MSQFDLYREPDPEPARSVALPDDEPAGRAPNPRGMMCLSCVRFRRCLVLNQTRAHYLSCHVTPSDYEAKA